jgi:flagellar biosynthesis/type III secretory pathway protein FliH
VKSLSRDADSHAFGPVIRVAVPARPASVRVFDGTRAGLAERLRRETLAREFERGRLEGERAALHGAAGTLNRATEAVSKFADNHCAELARDATRLAVEIARTLLRQELEAGRYDLERIVRETLQASGVGRGACVVHLNPADVARLEGVPFRAGTTIESDPEVPAGDVHVTTHRGLLVRDVEQALASISERLEGDAA